MKELKAKEGMYLTQVAEVGEERTFIIAIKGMNVKEEDWRDATLEEKEAFEHNNAQQSTWTVEDYIVQQPSELDA